MKKVIICVTVIVLSLFPLTLSFSSFDTKAYTSPDNLFTTCVFSSVKNCSLNPSYDGVYIIQTSYKSSYSPDIINSPVRLDKTQFLSGTWNGQTINELDSQYLYNIDVTGFSQTVSYSDEKDYFVYSLVTCLPVKAGDDFNIIFNINSANVTASSHSTVISYIPGGTGCRMVHSENGTTHPENLLTYTVGSKNQHIALVFNPDTFNTDYVNSGFSRSFSNRINCETVSGLNFVGMHSKSVDIFTTSYNYTGDISVSLKESIDNYSFSVYEIFTDGTVTPGYNTEVEQPTSSASSGGVSVDLSEVLQRLIEIRQAIDDKVIEVTVNVSSAVLDKLDSILGTLSNLPSDMWDSFKVGLSEMFRIDEDTSEPEAPPPVSSSDESNSGSAETTTTSISLEIDQENFDKVMEEVNIDNLGSNIAGPKGAIAFFWYITDKFFDNMGLYTAVYISLFLAFCAWLLRS